MTPRRDGAGLVVPLLLLAAISTLVGCGGGPSNEPAAEAPAETSSDEATTDEQEKDQEGEGGGEGERGEGGSGQEDAEDTEDPEQDGQLSEIERYLGYAIPGLGQGDDLDLRRREQDTLASCMLAQGFEYVAWVEDPSVVYVPVEEGLDHESRAFAATYGFGISTQAYAQSDVGPGLAGHRGDGSGVDVAADPNAAIRANLSPAELVAYDKAFFGAESPMLGGPLDEEDGPDGVLEARQMVSFGCIGEAQRAIDGEAGAVLDAFADQILGMEGRAYADPRYLRYTEDVERCVHQAGFDFYTGEPIWATFAYFDELVAQFDRKVGGDPFGPFDEDDLADMTAGEIDALYDRPRDIPGELLDDLAEIQDLETRTATAVWDCGGSPAGQREVLDEILVGMEAAFILEHADELERFRR